jgi:cytochrome c oxidase subunit 4
MSLYLTWGVLMVLLTATVGSALVPLGHWNSVINFIIACAKATLVATIFMQLRSASALIRLVAISALFMLALLFGLSATDYATRSNSIAPLSTPRGASGTNLGAGDEEAARISHRWQEIPVVQVTAPRLLPAPSQ